LKHFYHKQKQTNKEKEENRETRSQRLKTKRENKEARIKTRKGRTTENRVSNLNENTRERPSEAVSVPKMKKGEKNPKNENQCRKKLDTNCNVKNTKIGLKFEKTMEKRRKLVEKTMPTMPKGGERCRNV